MNKIQAGFRDIEGMDNFNVSMPTPKIVNTLEIKERERRKKNYEALRSMLAVITGSEEWDAYTYSELIEGARNALAAEAQRIK